MTSSTQGTRAAASAPEGEVNSDRRRSGADSFTARRAGVVISTSPIASSRTQSTLRARRHGSLEVISGAAPVAQVLAIARTGGDGPVVPARARPANSRDDVGGGAVGPERQDLDDAAEALHQFGLGER